MVCKLCGRPIDSPRSAWKESKGWVSPHGAKGMTLAKPTGELAHPECVQLLKVGVNIEQSSLASLLES